MNLLDAYALSRAAGIKLIAAASAYSEQELCEHGMPARDAAALAQLADVYSHTVTSSRKQARAVAGLNRLGHDIATIETIEAWVAKIKDHNKAWDLRETLCNTSAAKIDVVAKTELKKLRTKRTPATGVRLYKHTDRLSTLAITGDANVLDAVMRTVDGNIERFRECFFTGGATMPQLTTNVVVPLTDLVRIIDGDTDDICLRTNAGTTITGAEFVQSQLAEHGIFTLVDTMGEPVDAYRTTRFANTKQRLMLEAEYSHCAWDGCKVPVRDCQFHHIIAWRAGGYTNYSNLIPLCAYHNGINEDDPAKPAPRGRFAHRDGRKVFIPGWAGIAINADLPPP